MNKERVTEMLEEAIHLLSTDLEKWMKHLNETDIKYRVDETLLMGGEPVTVLCLTDRGIFNEERASLYIIFDDNGKFKFFKPVN